MSDDELSPLEVIRHYPPHGETLPGLLASRAAAIPGAAFLTDGSRTVSWAECEARVGRLAAGLAARGIGDGARVAVVSRNRIETVLLLFAASRLRAILMPLNPELTAAEIAALLDHAQPAAIFAAAEALGTRRDALRKSGYASRVFCFDGAREQAEDFASLGAGAAPPACAARPEDTCLLLYTSGTTGAPKGVLHSQRNFVRAGEAFVERMHLQPDDRLLCVLPFFHINALFYSLAGSAASGATLIVAPRFSASNFWRFAARTGATEVNIIATVGNILARRPRAEFVPHAIRKLYGAPIPPRLREVLREEFGIPVLIEGYGMTEVPGAINQVWDAVPKPGSMGRAARHPDPQRPFAGLRVLDEAGRECAPDEAGELWVKTPILMQGYFRDPEASIAAVREGWFRTGDLVRRDAAGEVTFVARLKDIIRRRGENVSGAELDQVIGSHPAIQEAAAIAVPSELGEDEILVAAVLKPGERLNAADLARWCAGRLAAHKLPRYVAFVEALPHTPTHRVAKHRLRSDPGLTRSAVDLAATRPA